MRGTMLANQVVTSSAGGRIVDLLACIRAIIEDGGKFRLSCKSAMNTSLGSVHGALFLSGRFPVTEGKDVWL